MYMARKFLVAEKIACFFLQKLMFILACANKKIVFMKKESMFFFVKCNFERRSKFAIEKDKNISIYKSRFFYGKIQIIGFLLKNFMVSIFFKIFV